MMNRRAFVRQYMDYANNKEQAMCQCWWCKTKRLFIHKKEPILLYSFIVGRFESQQTMNLPFRVIANNGLDHPIKIKVEKL